MFQRLSNLFTPLVCFSFIVGVILALPTSGFSAETYTVPQTAGAAVSWEENDPVPEGYRIYQRKQGEAYDYDNPCWTGSGTSGNVYNLEWETTYYFVVRAYDGTMESPDSEEVSCVTPTAPATNETHTIVTTAEGNGTVSPAGSITLSKGESQTVSIIPDTGYRIEDVRVDSQSVGPVPSYTFIEVDADHSLHVVFTILSNQIVATASEGGTITPSGTVTLTYGSTQTYTISPETGYRIEDVRVDGLSIGSVQSYTFGDVTTSHTISAFFSKMPHTVTIESSGNGSVSPDGIVAVDDGADLVITATPEQGYDVEDVVVDGLSAGNGNPYTLSNITGDHHVVIHFAQREAPPVSMEVGEVTIDHNWKRVAFTNTYTDPIVVAGPLSTRDDAPAVARIRNVDATGFEIAVSEWDYLDGIHGNETIGYMVMERGHFTLDNGFMVEAGTFDSAQTSGFDTISFEQPFIDPPVVVTSVATVNETDTVTGRIQNINTGGFGYRFQEQESHPQTHAVETVHYIAWEPSSGVIGDWMYDVGRTGTSVDNTLFELSSFTAAEKDAWILGDLQSFIGGDPANVRYQETATGIGVFVDEEQSYDEETWHLQEIVGYMVFSTDPNSVVEEPIIDGLIALYDFTEGSGSVVYDRSGFGESLDLTIADPSAVAWIQGGGLSIVSPTIVQSPANATKITRAITATGQMTIEAWIKPDNAEQAGPARIITLSGDPYSRNFTLGQDLAAYDVRCRTTDTSSNGIPSVSIQGPAENRLAHVVYTRDAQGLANIYIDGTLAVSQTVTGDVSNWQDFAFALANELTGDRPWLGEYHMVALFDRALTAEEVLKNASSW